MATESVTIPNPKAVSVFDDTNLKALEEASEGLYCVRGVLSLLAENGENSNETTSLYAAIRILSDSKAILDSTVDSAGAELFKRKQSVRGGS